MLRGCSYIVQLYATRHLGGGAESGSSVCEWPRKVSFLPSFLHFSFLLFGGHSSLDSSALFTSSREAAVRVTLLRYTTASWEGEKRNNYIPSAIYDAYLCTPLRYQSRCPYGGSCACPFQHRVLAFSPVLNGIHVSNGNVLSVSFHLSYTLSIYLALLVPVPQASMQHLL